MKPGTFVDYYESAMITGIEPCLHKVSFLKITTNKTFKGFDICMYVPDTTLTSLRVEDTLFVHQVYYSKKDKFLLVHGWQMIHHHPGEISYIKK